MKKIIVIVGPTASGKTDLSLKIAKLFNGECINADSTQIFKGTDIATNKIKTEEMQGVVHHLISIKEVNETYSVADYQTQARTIIDKILKQDKTPIVIGGTGLYINALIMNYNFLFENQTIVGFKEQFEELSNHQLWEQLNQIDTLAANEIHVNNRNKIIRALEIIEYSKSLKSDLNKNNKTLFYDNLIIIGIKPDREKLHQRINERVLQLTDRGLFDEIKKAYEDNNFNASAQALKCIGGPEIIQYLKQEIDYDQTIALMQRNNRRYARRQMTWFRNQYDNVHWFEHQYSDFEQMCDQVLEFLKTKIK
ncbi:tRNA (adenosine(37)-N6)-dimethylallyltransferase MiaA [Spiroplasma culicicola]|uniref:tRNA dimethylallyltransferase n=1 Tax=Spiroplasma culicicola AES-1 TaxID=1276246 RepID=W6A7S4_9MOLU|nr:tRNA (adenosine(37)-N6)-dimethylallyltransferase MiaA [Spiroplasma culicicola]AHI53037.1 tRNA delta(2)-isopentenylpyrophosphate transferase [Spiroplasma culicicola AES-1]